MTSIMSFKDINNKRREKVDCVKPLFVESYSNVDDLNWYGSAIGIACGARSYRDS